MFTTLCFERDPAMHKFTGERLSPMCCNNQHRAFGQSLPKLEEFAHELVGSARMSSNSPRSWSAWPEIGRKRSNIGRELA